MIFDNKLSRKHSRGLGKRLFLAWKINYCLQNQFGIITPVIPPGASLSISLLSVMRLLISAIGGIHEVTGDLMIAADASQLRSGPAADVCGHGTAGVVFASGREVIDIGDLALRNLTLSDTVDIRDRYG